MKRVYLIRHAETPPRPGKPSDGDAVGITPRGREAARAKSALLKHLGITALVASPLARAQETAKIFSDALNLPVMTDPRAREFVAADVPPPDFKPMRAKARAERDWAGQGGESFNASMARLSALLDSLTDRAMVVTHELLMQNVLMAEGAKVPPPLSHLSIIALEKHTDHWHVASVRQGRGFWQKLLEKFFNTINL